MHGAHAVGGAYKRGPHGPFPLVVSFVAGLGREGGGSPLSDLKILVNAHVFG